MKKRHPLPRQIQFPAVARKGPVTSSLRRVGRESGTREAREMNGNCSGENKLHRVVCPFSRRLWWGFSFVDWKRGGTQRMGRERAGFGLKGVGRKKEAKEEKEKEHEEEKDKRKNS